MAPTNERATEPHGVLATQDAVVASRAAPPAAVRAYAAVASQVLPLHCRPDRCVNASSIFVEVMHRLGFAGARACSVEVIAMNAAYRQYEVARTVEERREWENRGAWAVIIDGVAPKAGHMGWAGHVVGIVQDWLVDSATSQMSRPAKGIVLPEVLLVRATPRFIHGKEAAGATSSDGCVVRYRARPHDRSFERLPGFRRGHAGNLEIAAEIERAVRDLLHNVADEESE